jgi:hypothetical protein
MSKPNVYILGAHPKITLVTVDENGDAVLPTEARLSIQLPDQTVVTVSGAGMVNNTTYLSYVYTPQLAGWYEYEAWVKDTNGRESAAEHGFTIVDRVP